MAGGVTALAAAAVPGRAAGSGGPAIDASLAGLVRHEDVLPDCFRIVSDNSGKLSPNYWRGAYLVSMPGRSPAIRFHMEGCEMRRCIPLGGRRWRSEYRLMTSLVDPESDEVLNGRSWKDIPARHRAEIGKWHPRAVEWALG